MQIRDVMVLRVVALALVLSGHGSSAQPDQPAGSGDLSPDVLSSSPFASQNYYLSISIKSNWHKAHQFCQVHKMNLAVVPDRDRNDELIDLMKRNGVELAWIGVSDNADKDRYYNIGDGRFVAYTAWLAAQPDHKGGVERCVAVASADGKYGWSDEPCDMESSFVCSLKP